MSTTLVEKFIVVFNREFPLEIITNLAMISQCDHNDELICILYPLR